MKRSLAVSLLAILFVLVSLVGLLGPVLFLLSGLLGAGFTFAWNLDLPGLRIPLDAALLGLFRTRPTLALVLWLAFPIVLSLFFGLTGIGLWRRRNWARQAALVMAALATLNAIAKLCFLFFWQGGPTLKEYLILVLAALVWIAAVWYLSQPSLKQAFGRN